MSENFVTVAPVMTGLLADNGCILSKDTLNTDGYGYTKVKDELVVDYSVALDADLGRCLREGCSAAHHCDDISIGLSQLPKKDVQWDRQHDLSIEYKVSRRTIYKIDKGKTWQ